MMVSCFEHRQVEPSRVMAPYLELDFLQIVLRRDREAPRTLSPVVRQFAACEFSVSSGPVGRLYGELIAMWKSGIER